ncbi:hypothetical protein [Shewanella litorisediminis]|uniref:hypothetical protein n=1 Tax=Shewanella litorisediminis TaxID=1173586 RepID=UPI00201500A8|nr:hypothetical protein [Shewanella litorisediminis]MCL2919149.1 hypothetical protein [Shewanella litorisediminis]
MQTGPLSGPNEGKSFWVPAPEGPHSLQGTEISALLWAYRQSVRLQLPLLFVPGKNIGQKNNVHRLTSQPEIPFKALFF